MAEVELSMEDLGSMSVPLEIDTKGALEEMHVILKKLTQERDDLLDQKARMKSQMDDLFWRHQEMMLLTVNYISITENGVASDNLRDHRQELKENIEAEFMRIFPNSCVPPFLEKILLDPKMKLVSALCHEREETSEEADNEFNELCEALVYVFESQEKSRQLLQWAVETQVQSAKSTSALFREDEAGARIMRCYFFLIAKDYLRAVLSPCINKILSTKRSYEIDPAKVGAAEAKRNLTKLKRRITGLLDRLFKSPEDCPMEMRLTFAYIAQTVKKKYGLISADLYVGAAFFLRFVCPSIVVPSLIGINEIPTPEAQRGLINVAKYLQSLANRIPFGGPEFLEMNDFVSQQVFHLENFLAELSNVKEEDNPAGPGFEVSSGNKSQALDYITSYARQKLETMDPVLPSNQSILGIIGAALKHKQTSLRGRNHLRRPSSCLNLDELCIEAESGKIGMEIPFHDRTMSLSSIDDIDLDANLFASHSPRLLNLSEQQMINPFGKSDAISTSGRPRTMLWDFPAMSLSAKGRSRSNPGSPIPEHRAPSPLGSSDQHIMSAPTSPLMYSLADHAPLGVSPPMIRPSFKPTPPTDAEMIRPTFTRTFSSPKMKASRSAEKANDLKDSKEREKPKENSGKMNPLAFLKPKSTHTKLGPKKISVRPRDYNASAPDLGFRMP
eukprot:TRINITY_DN2815_c2_g2_i1.p1 TRINITY_DN2815_c2_g2~~TRINITY_DN2815_c2_g2_i1.p1  ORF type:complete len:672 (-),score=178.74 TRINITY_DN2815_c2_g2_i1:275-2290(-)